MQSFQTSVGDGVCVCAVALCNPVSSCSLPPPAHSCFTCMRCHAKAHCFTTSIPRARMNQEGLFYIKCSLQVVNSELSFPQHSDTSSSRSFVHEECDSWFTWRFYFVKCLCVFVCDRQGRTQCKSMSGCSCSGCTCDFLCFP